MEGFAQIVSWDVKATVWLNTLNSPFPDSVWTFFSGVAVWIPLYFFILYLHFRTLGWKRGLLSLVCVTLTVLCCDQTANLVKDMVSRMRPCFTPWCLENGLHVLEQGNPANPFGFFSAHAANSFGVAICTSILLRDGGKRKWMDLYTTLILLWAILVGLSRVFVGKHFILDVLVGTVAGLFFGSAFALLMRFLIWRRWLRRCPPPECP